RVPAGRGAGTAERGGAAAAVADLGTGADQRGTSRLADGGFGRGADLAGPGGGRGVRRFTGRTPVLVPLPPPVRRPAPAGAPAYRAGRVAGATRGCCPVVRRAWPSRRCGPSRPGGAGLEPGRMPAVRPLGRS